MNLLYKFLCFIKKFYRKYKINKHKKYLRYIKNVLNLSQLELSTLTPHDKITKLDIQKFPSIENIRFNKIKIKNKYIDNISKINPVCTMLELYANSNKLNIKRISRKFIFKYILLADNPELKKIDMKACLNFIKNNGALIDKKETEKLINGNAFINTSLIKDLIKYSILNYFTIENIRNDEKTLVFNRDEIIILKIKDCICKGIPVLIGIELYTGFIKNTKGNLEQQKYIGSLEPNSKPIGVYGLNIIGYNSDNKTFLIYSGWGNEFGDNGIFLLPYQVLLKDIKELWYINGLTISNYKE